MPDARVIERLSSLPGIGVWTAEMLLIFSLCRPDVVSWGDLAIRRGMMNLYGLKDLSKKQFDRFRKEVLSLRFGCVALFVGLVGRIAPQEEVRCFIVGI